MLKNWKISHKLWLSVAAIVVALTTVIGFSAYRTAAMRGQSDAMAAAIEQRRETVQEWASLTNNNAVRTLALILSEEPAVAAEFAGAMKATSAKISELQKSLGAMDLSAPEKAQMEKIFAARKNMAEQRDHAQKLQADGQAGQAILFVKKTYIPASDAYLKTLDDFVLLEKQIMQDTRAEMTRAGMRTVMIAAVSIALLLCAIVAGAYFLIRSIRQPLVQANELATRIAGGDLSVQVEVDRGDEFGELLRALNAMCESLGRMVQQVRQSTDSIATASSEIAAGNNDLSARTEQTSSNLQETAAAMEEFTSTIAQSASSAQQASSLANNAAGVARQGGSVVAQVVSTMEEIQQSSRKIEDIIGVIDGIAFQTNILALNAAVEAARAGEQGRGFAVVAGEVRSLAGRSAEAAKEIKQLIGISVDKVHTGSGLVQQAGSTMGEIVQSVQRVTDMIGEVTAASTEQSAGIAQVNQSVGQLDQMTQQNAALVEQSAAAAQSLREQAEQLAQVVARFKVQGVASPASHRSAAAPVRSPMAAAKPKPAVTAPAPAAARPQVTKPAASAPRLATTPTPVAAAKPTAAADDDWESF